MKWWCPKRTNLLYSMPGKCLSCNAPLQPVGAVSPVLQIASAISSDPKLLRSCIELVSRLVLR
jgi:hypothetical protein